MPIEPPMSRALLSCDRPVLAGRAGPQQHVQGALLRGDQPCGKPLLRQNRIAIEVGSLPVNRLLPEKLCGKRVFRWHRGSSNTPDSQWRPWFADPAPLLRSFPRRGHAKTVMCDDPFIRTGLLRIDHRGRSVPAPSPRWRASARTPLWCGWHFRVHAKARRPRRTRRTRRRKEERRGEVTQRRRAPLTQTDV
jgi:hypothetical protein